MWPGRSVSGEAALARAMEWLYDHPEERIRMGQAARERIATHFRNDVTVARRLPLRGSDGGMTRPLIRGSRQPIANLLPLERMRSADPNR
jgi:hypothetical protein